VYTAVDAEECARIANILSLENAVQAEKIYVQAEEIAHLRGILETHPLQGIRRFNHE
jgi:hypothetical protein